ncbi:MAG: ribonuclease P protein component [Acidobacteriota bacterium]
MAPIESPPGQPPTPVPGSQRFLPVERIRRRREYQTIYDTGTRLSGRYMTMFLAGNAAGWPRLGIAATRKLGCAVERNRAKRMVREVFRQNKPRVALDIVVIPRRTLLEARFEAIEADFCGLLRRRIRKNREE